MLATSVKPAFLKMRRQAIYMYDDNDFIDSPEEENEAN